MVHWLSRGSDTPEMVPVRGRVTLEDGDWPGPGMLISRRWPRRPASRRGRVAAHLTPMVCFGHTGQHDGLLPGTYNVAVDCHPPADQDEVSGSSYGARGVHERARGVSAIDHRARHCADESRGTRTSHGSRPTRLRHPLPAQRGIRRIPCVGRAFVLGPAKSGRATLLRLDANWISPLFAWICENASTNRQRVRFWQSTRACVSCLYVQQT